MRGCKVFTLQENSHHGSADSSFFQEPPFPHRRMMGINLLITGTFLRMIVDDAAGLQMRIDRYRTQVFEAIGFELPGNFIRQPVADGNPSILMPHIQDCFPVGMGPEPIGETAMFLSDFLIASGIIDDRFDLPAGTDHALSIYDAFYIRVRIGGDSVIIKAVKAETEDLPLFDHQTPGEAALHGLHHQMFKHTPVIMHRHAPLGIVVSLHSFKSEAQSQELMFHSPSYLFSCSSG